jgi:hypothetical protein
VDKIPFVDHPELKINKNESTQMPFRYVKGDDGRPIMPEVRACSHVFTCFFRLNTISLTSSTGNGRSDHQRLREEPGRSFVGSLFARLVDVPGTEAQQRIEYATKPLWHAVFDGI